jgi:hypothetical protein
LGCQTINGLRDGKASVPSSHPHIIKIDQALEDDECRGFVANSSNFLPRRINVMGINGIGPNWASGIGLAKTAAKGLDLDDNLGKLMGQTGFGSMEQSMMNTLQSVIQLMTQILQGANQGLQGVNQGMNGGQQPGSDFGSYPSSNPTPSNFAPQGNMGADLGTLLKGLGEFANVLGDLFQGGQGANFNRTSVQQV